MGGQGSGRKPDPVKRLVGFGQPAPTDDGAIYLPNYSGIKKEAKNTDPTDLGAGGGDNDKVAIDDAATAGFLGAASSDGVLRTDATLTYADGGDFVTLGVANEFTDADESKLDGIEEGADVTDATNVAAAGAAMAGGAFHDGFSDFVANEHIDWTQASAGTIHASNYVDNDTTDHTALSNIGTNTHAQIDTHIGSSSNPHSVTYTQVGAIQDAADTVKDTHIDWGTGASQVSAADIPIADSGSIITATEVEAALQEIKTAVDLNTTHAADNSQAHSDYLVNNANDTTSGKITAEGFETTGDRSSADTAYVPMVLYNTDATPPAASGFPIGTIYIQYTA